MLKRFFFLIFFFISECSVASQGGLGLDISRVIFNEDSSSVSFTAKNNSSTIVALLKVWAENYYSDAPTPPFFITPPLTRIDPGDNIQFRVNKLEGVNKLPKDRESVFAINVLAIPPKKEKNAIQIALNSRIKLFYRPKEISKILEADNIQNEIKVSPISGGIIINNPTPYYVTLKNVRVNNVPTKDFSYMIQPYSDMKIPCSGARKITFSIINDYGATTPPREIVIKS